MKADHRNQIRRRGILNGFPIRILSQFPLNGSRIHQIVDRHTVAHLEHGVIGDHRLRTVGNVQINAAEGLLHQRHMVSGIVANTVVGQNPVDLPPAVAACGKDGTEAFLRRHFDVVLLRQDLFSFAADLGDNEPRLHIEQ